MHIAPSPNICPSPDQRPPAKRAAEFDEIFDFYRDSGFLYPAKLAALAPRQSVIEQTWRRLLAADPVLFRFFANRAPDGALAPGRPAARWAGSGCAFTPTWRRCCAATPHCGTARPARRSCTHCARSSSRAASAWTPATASTWPRRFPFSSSGRARPDHPRRARPPSTRDRAQQPARGVPRRRPLPPPRCPAALRPRAQRLHRHDGASTTQRPRPPRPPHPQPGPPHHRGEPLCRPARTVIARRRAGPHHARTGSWRLRCSKPEAPGVVHSSARPSAATPQVRSGQYCSTFEPSCCAGHYDASARASAPPASSAHRLASPCAAPALLESSTVPGSDDRVLSACARSSAILRSSPTTFGGLEHEHE